MCAQWAKGDKGSKGQGAKGSKGPRGQRVQGPCQRVRRRMATSRRSGSGNRRDFKGRLAGQKTDGCPPMRAVGFRVDLRLRRRRAVGAPRHHPSDQRSAGVNAGAGRGDRHARPEGARGPSPVMCWAVRRPIWASCAHMWKTWTESESESAPRFQT